MKQPHVVSTKKRMKRVGPILLLANSHSSWSFFLQSGNRPQTRRFVAKPSYEDTSGIFSSGTSYIPAGLTKEEWVVMRQEEAATHKSKNYGAWGPHFQRSDGPVADDMAWMVMPDLWTGKTAKAHDEMIVEDNDDDPELPLNEDFLKDVYPWQHGKDSVRKYEDWKTTFSKFCQGDTIQQMALEEVEGNSDTGLASKANELVEHILEGVVMLGGRRSTTDGKVLDLSPLAIYSPPSRSDWKVMQQVEDSLELDLEASPDTMANGEILVGGQVSRTDLLRAIVQARFEDSHDDIFSQFPKETLSDMYLCLEWYLTLRRVGISDPFAD